MKKKTKNKAVAAAPVVDEKVTLTIDVDQIDRMFSETIGTLMALQALWQLIAEQSEEVKP